jgi:alkylated DNA repair dioxygenase AlkB
LHVQEDLFETGPASLSVDRSFATARRMALDPGSWIDVVPGWISGSHELLEQLAVVVPWRQHDRQLFDQTVREPRMTAQYRSLRDVPAAALLEAAQALSRHYGVQYDALWLNFYRDGQDSTAWHRDRVGRGKPECIVPVLTLGATRRFLVKPRSGGRSLVFRPRSGDLIVMGGRSQVDWVHSVPKDSGVTEQRISVNFQSSQQAERDTEAVWPPRDTDARRLTE